MHSADSSTADATPSRETAEDGSPPGSIMHGIDLDDTFTDNDVEHRGSLVFGHATNQTFGDADFEDFGESRSPRNYPAVSTGARAVSILLGDIA